MGRRSGEEADEEECGEGKGGGVGRSGEEADREEGGGVTS